MLNKGALGGIKVLDLTQFESGTVCTETLAWLGADVYKVERPKKGELGRYSVAEPDIDSVGFIILNMNKKSVTLDIKSSEGKKILKELVEKCDVLVENMGPGSIDRLGFSYEDAKAYNPKIIYAQIKGFGLDGPWKDYPAFNPIAAAVGGMTAITGDPEGPPMQSGLNLADSGAGYICAMAISAALFQREKTGKGQRIEVSMQDTVIGFGRSAWEPYYRTGKPAPRVGNGMPLEDVAPAGMYPCKPFGPNDYVHIYCSRHPGSLQWASLCKIIGREDALEDERLKTPRSRYQYKEIVDQMITDWTKQHTKYEAMDILCKADVPAGAALDTEDITKDEYLRKRGMMIEVDHPRRGKLVIPGFIPRMSENQVAMKVSPQLGENNEEVYKELLGYSKEEIDNLKEAGVI
ncbi:CaiB/BaiF CoA transferase family protein [Geosporobacter ferrireducens]|uniref:Formyl-CoA transferase n=1 Tax=Geosporobacter ferrireducens TaxID=1424294 RepID=A0A1D8GFY4_9FIRM|nr:CoA transferase [Geosporobacter ferrireducens]AOT69812.1 hypothetical protein Gferi_09610 [Geosporobacter ferrireducens]